MTRSLRAVSRFLVFATAVCTASYAWAATSTFVQGTSSRSWLDSANWANGDIGPAPPTTGGGTVPNAVGDVAILQQRVTSNAGMGSGSTFQISLGSGSPTIGTLTVRNTDNAYTTAIVSGTLNFDNGASPAVFNEDTGTVVPTTNSSRTRINVPVNINSDFVVNQNHNLNFNTATEFVQQVNQAADKTFTKNGQGNLQFAYGLALAANEGIQGDVFINEGAIRLINGNSASTNTIFNKSTGITVADGAQFQLGNGITSFNLGPGAELKLNGVGKPDNLAFPEGALRFEESATFRFVVDFNSPIRLQTQSRIFVTAADTTAKLNEEVRGDGAAGLNKGGPGLLKLTTTSANGNTYAGSTNVSNGALAVNNTVATSSGVGTGDVFVNNGGLVGGTGTIGTTGDASNVSVSDGTLSPGDLSIDSTSGELIESAGTLSVLGDVSFTNESFLNMNIGTTSDQLVASGAIALAASTLNLDLGAFVPDGSQSFTLISNTGAGAIGGMFGTININGAAATGPDLDLNGQTYHLSYAAGLGGNDLVLLPGAASAGLAGDYNDDGIVDAADYVIWRKGGPLANDTAPAGAGPEDYTKWVEQFGSTSPGGGGVGGGAVPEPTSGLLALFAFGAFAGLAKRR